MLPFWFVGPLAAVTMVLIAGHLLAMRAAMDRVPASRYRVRTVNGGLMLTVTPLLACAFSVVPPSEARLFVLLWFVCVGLLAIIVVLAAVDAGNNMRLLASERARLREAHAAETAGLLAVKHELSREQGRDGDAVGG